MTVRQVPLNRPPQSILKRRLALEPEYLSRPAHIQLAPRLAAWPERRPQAGRPVVVCRRVGLACIPHNLSLEAGQAGDGLQNRRFLNHRHVLSGDKRSVTSGRLPKYFTDFFFGLQSVSFG